MARASWLAQAPRSALTSESGQALQLVLVCGPVQVYQLPLANASVSVYGAVREDELALRVSVPACGLLRAGELALAGASVPASRPAHPSCVAKVCESAAAFRLAQPSLSLPAFELAHSYATAESE